jgi:hypothetical protein
MTATNGSTLAKRIGPLPERANAGRRGLEGQDYDYEQSREGILARTKALEHDDNCSECDYKSHDSLIHGNIRRRDIRGHNRGSH